MAWAVAPRIAVVAVLVLADLHVLAKATDQVVTPVAKVIDLLKSLTKEVQEGGKREAATYQKFSCWCKSSTESKGKEITQGADKIDELSSSIEAKSAEKKEKQQAMSERMQKQESMSAELDDEKARCLKEEHTHDAKMAEVTKAISGIGDALRSLKNARKGAAASLLDLHSPVRQSLDLAMALELAESPARQAATAFLQEASAVDPQDAEYNFHSGGIESILKMLQTDYTKNKDKAEGEWQKTDKACTQTKETLGKDLKNNKDAITKLDEKAEGLAKDIAQAKEDLVSEQTSLQDAQEYLKDMTLRCEARAKDWDQRSATRDGEFQALTKAVEILSGKVKDADAAVNKRALLLSPRRAVPSKRFAKVTLKAPKPIAAAPKTGLFSTEITLDGASDSTEIATELTALEGSDTSSEADPIAGDLPGGVSDSDVTSWLHESTGAASFVQIQSARQSLQKQRQDQVLASLQQEGKRLGSATLTSLALHVAGDPFEKVKGLIQSLLERLLSESAAEATKKGFCDEELGKVTQARDYSFEEANRLSAEIKILEVNEERLNTEVDELKDRLDNLHNEFDEAKKLREQEKKDNISALSKADEGLEAVTEAYNILKGFYGQAGKSAAALLQASPIDEDAPDAPEGEYKGKQGASQGILGLLQVIISDFERTLRKTSADEKKAASDFTEMKQNFEADEAAHTTKRQLAIQDAKTTASAIKRKMKDTKFAMDSVDSNLKTLADLKPTCIESGRMSFKERTEKRTQEMAALKQALCKLDAEGVEADCK